MRVDVNEFDINHNTENKRSDRYYTINGVEEFLDDKGYPRLKEESDKTYAKAIYNKKSRNITDFRTYYSYYALSSPSGELYNPVTLHSTVKSKAKNNFINTICKDDWSFKEVNKSVFDTYIQFLKTQNTRILSKANRSLK
jgi:hypothetical protein